MNRVCCGAVKIFMGNKSSPLCAFLHLTPLLRGRAVLLPEQFVEAGAVGKFEL